MTATLNSNDDEDTINAEFKFNIKEDCRSETELEPSQCQTKIRRKKFILGNHIEIIGEEPLMYMCTICKHKFKWKHQGAYHEYCKTGIRPLQCKLCPKRFVTNSHLQYHLLSHNGGFPYKCTTCSKTFKQKDKLKRHEMIHKDSNAGKQACYICNKWLSCASSLKIHMFTHSEDRPFKCEQCEKGYTNEYDYKRHLTKHTGASNFVCEHCGKSFPRKFLLNAHYVIHSSYRPFKCSTCNCAFKKKHELIRHVKQHKKIIVYECNLCSTKFSRKDNLLRHARGTHPGEKIIVKVLNTQDETKDTEDISMESPPIRKSVIVNNPLRVITFIQSGVIRQPVIQFAPPSLK